MAEISATEILPQLLKSRSARFRIDFGTMAKDQNELADPRETEFYEDLSWRLKLAIEAIDRPKGEIAKSISVSQSRLSNWITDQNKPDWFGVAKLCRRYGISADWVLLGDLKGVPHTQADRWGEAWEDRKGVKRTADTAPEEQNT